MSRARFAVAVAACLLTACEVSVKDRPSRTIPVSVDAGKAELARVELHMKVGDLNVAGGSSNLLSGELRYLDPDKPVVDANNSSFRARVVIDQPMTVHSSRGDNFRWDLKLIDTVPVDLSVDFGVGRGELNLGSVDLKNLEVKMGVGELKIDLRGTPKHDYSVNIRGGVGRAVLYLPASAGIEVEAKGGIGGIRVRGLELRDGRYVSQANGKFKTNIRVDIAGGIGGIEVIAE